MPVVPGLRELAALTSDEAGAQRLAWTPTWERARDWFDARCAGLPVTLARDEAGNQWATLEGAGASVLVIGGHLDSVANGGWLDGCLNVVAGLEVLSALAAEGPLPVTVAVVSWADEEGARFGRSLFGSSAAAGRLDVEAARGLRDAQGVTLPQALAEHGVDLDTAGLSARRLSAVKAYLELHIEQGPALEALGVPLGVVLGTVGVRRHRLRFSGQAAHAGSTPMDARQDALVAAAELTLAVREIALAHGGVGTVGGVWVEPGLPTIVPGACEATLDQRHLDPHALDAMLEAARQAAAAAAAREGVSVEWSPLFSADPVPFHPDLIGICEAAVRAESGSSHRLPSGPLHDATSMAQAGIPAGMIFVRSLRGLSHCKEEDSLAEDLEMGARAMARAARATIAWLVAERGEPGLR
ncbi:MAG: Zn-dependent hydrolase [Chloroflexota bacterium]